MSCTNVDSQHYPVSGGTRRAIVAVPVSPDERQVHRPAPRSPALAFVMEADHDSIWPTHRIRSFLISQQSGMSSSTPRGSSL